MDDRTRDRRHRRTFWIDDRVLDEFAPVMGEYPFGAAAVAVYAVLARRADRDGDSWPRLRAIAEQAATSQRTVRRAIHLLEALGLVDVAACYEDGSNRQTSNLYTLLTPPETVPQLDRNPERWPVAGRRRVVVRGGNRGESVTDARAKRAESGSTPRPAGPAPPATLTGGPGQPDSLPPASVAGHEGNTGEGNTEKERSFVRDGETARRPDGEENGAPGALATFAIEEVGLSNRQVWAATLGELTRRGEVSSADVDAWLRPAALIGRDGKTLVIGVPNAVSRDRIATRLLPALRDAIGATIGARVGLSVVVEEGVPGTR